jgi:hypothetical protein
MMLESQIAGQFKWPVDETTRDRDFILEGNNTNEAQKPTVPEHVVTCNNGLLRSLNKEGKYCKGE